MIITESELKEIAKKIAKKQGFVIIKESKTLSEYHRILNDLKKQIDSERSKYSGDDGLSYDAIQKISAIRKKIREHEKTKKEWNQ